MAYNASHKRPKNRQVLRSSRPPRGWRCLMALLIGMSYPPGSPKKTKTQAATTRPTAYTMMLQRIAPELTKPKYRYVFALNTRPQLWHRTLGGMSGMFRSLFEAPISTIAERASNLCRHLGHCSNYLSTTINACINSARLGRPVEAHRAGANLMRLLNGLTPTTDIRPRRPALVITSSPQTLQDIRHYFESSSFPVADYWPATDGGSYYSKA